jgi:hypothetical protein
MTRRYGEPVDVRHRDDLPAEFLWQDRRYVVRDILAHWIETAPWWLAPPASGGAIESERELWRVEASAGRLQSQGIYDLCFDWTTGRWTLVRTMD